jgi:hypothetical protein
MKPDPIALADASPTRPYLRQLGQHAVLPLPRGTGGDVIASLPFAVRRLFVDKEDAVAVIDERGAVGEEQCLEPGFIVGGRLRLCSRRRSVGRIGWIIHVV